MPLSQHQAGRAGHCNKICTPAACHSASTKQQPATRFVNATK